MVEEMKTLKLTCAFCEVQLKPLEMGIVGLVKRKIDILEVGGVKVDL